MPTPFSIDPGTGNIQIGETILLEPRSRIATIEPMVADWLAGSSDMGNGYAWLNLTDLSFGGAPAGLALCFHDGRFEQASWNVDLPDATLEDGWPTREAIDAEIAFVRRTLATEMNISLGKTTWGELWCDFDGKAFLASNGLRYR